MKNHVPISECPRCKGLDAYYYLNFLGSDEDSGGIPAPLYELVEHTAGTGMYENITRCPDCGTYYSNTNDCGFMENDIAVSRVSPTEAHVGLSPEALECFQNDLSHKDAQTREYAAECLLDHFDVTGQLDEIEKLFKHTDRDVRLRSVVCLLKRDKSKYEKMYKDVVDHDPDSQVRSNALRYFSFNDAVTGKLIPYFVTMMKDPGMKYGAAGILDNYLYDNPPDRRKIINAEIKKQKVDLKDPTFEYLKKKLEKS